MSAVRYDVTPPPPNEWRAFVRTLYRALCMIVSELRKLIDSWES